MAYFALKSTRSLLSTLIIVPYCSYGSAALEAQAPSILYRHGAVNFTLSWDQSELAQFAGSLFGFYLDSSYYYFAYSLNISAPIVPADTRASEYWSGRLRTFILHKSGGTVDFVVELSDLKFTDGITMTLRKYKLISGTLSHVDISTTYLIFGPPEECGSLYPSPLVLGTSFYANVTLCANPQPTVFFTYGDSKLPGVMMDTNGFGTFTFYLNIMKVSSIATSLSYEASNSIGSLKGFTLLVEDDVTPPCCINNGACEQTCLNTSCSCYLGRLQSNGRTCSEHEFLAFAARTSITTVNANHTKDGKLVHPYPVIFGMMNAVGLDYNYDAEVFYYTDLTQKLIAQVGLDGSSKRILKTGQATADGLAFDWVRNHLYWTEAETRAVYYLDLNSNTDKLVYQSTQATSVIRALALRPEECDRLMFWTDWGAIPYIARSSMDEVSPVYIVSSEVMWPNGLTIDHMEKFVYWVDGYFDRIERCDFFGKNRATVVVGAGNGFGIQLFHGYIYWTARSIDGTSVGVYRNQSGIKELVLSTTSEPFGLVAVSRASRYHCDMSTITTSSASTRYTSTSVISQTSDSNVTTLMPVTSRQSTITTPSMIPTDSPKCTTYTCPRYSDCWDIPVTHSPVCRCNYAYVMVDNSCVKVKRYVEVKGFKLNDPWKADYEDSNSLEYKLFVTNIDHVLSEFMKTRDPDILSTTTTRLLPGSVVVNFHVIFAIEKDVDISFVVQMLKAGLQSGQLTLNANLKDLEVIDPLALVGPSKSSSAGMVVGIAVGVTVAVLVLVVLSGSVIYILRRSPPHVRPAHVNQMATYAKDYASPQKTVNPYEGAPPPYEPTYEEIPTGKNENVSIRLEGQHLHRLDLRPPTTNSSPDDLAMADLAPRYGNVTSPALLTAPGTSRNPSVEDRSAIESAYYEVELQESSPPSPAESLSEKTSSHLSTPHETCPTTEIESEASEVERNYLSIST